MNDNKIVWIRPYTGSLNEDWVKQKEGILRIRTGRNGKYYGMVDGVFVAEKNLLSIPDNTPVKIVAIRQEDGRWVALNINKI